MRYRHRRHSLPAALKRVIRYPPRTIGQAVIWLVFIGIALIWVVGFKLWGIAFGGPAPVPVQPKSEFIGRVVHVDDGDTVVVKSKEHGEIKVRLSSIDAPETSHGATRPGQPFGPRSKAGLREMVHNKTVTVSCYEIDRYQRHICKLTADGVDVNAEMVRRGLAWVYRSNPRYVRDKGLYQVEEAAKAARRGLWAQEHATAPWEWRTDCWRERRCELD